MPSKLFYELDMDKQKRILEAGISEFATCGYESCSTNKIVQKAGISKGSLFKYFQNKEELYFHILDCVTKELEEAIVEGAVNLPKELLERIVKCSELEFFWYIRNPIKCKLITAAFTENVEEIYQKVRMRYKYKEQDIYYSLMEDIDESTLRWDKQRTVAILKWFLKGFNDDFNEHIELSNGMNIENIKEEYVKKLTEHIMILKYGLVNEGEVL